MDKSDNSLIAGKLRTLLAESFVEVKGYFLSKDSSFMETLDGIDAARASASFPRAEETIVGHVRHVMLALNYARDYLDGKDLSGYSWDGHWKDGVDAAGWEALKVELRREYEKTLAFVDGVEDWLAGHNLDLMAGIVAHCAYHLAIIRQHLDD